MDKEVLLGLIASILMLVGITYILFYSGLVI